MSWFQRRAEARSIAAALVLSSMAGAAFAQAALPPPSTFDTRPVTYAGPGLLCGAAFSLSLRPGEKAVLDVGPPSSLMTITLDQGRLVVRESQYATRGGTVIAKTQDGVVRRVKQEGQYIWTYQDRAPGSTDLYGDAVNSEKPTPAFKRIVFGAVKDEKVGGVTCLAGVRSPG